MIWRWRFEPCKTEAGNRPCVWFLCKLGLVCLDSIKSNLLSSSKHWSIFSAKHYLACLDTLIIHFGTDIIELSRFDLICVLKWISNWRSFRGDILSESNSILLMGICGVENARIGDLCCGLTLWWDRWFSLPLSRKGWLSTSTWAHIPKPFPIMSLPFPSVSRFQISQKQETRDAKFLPLSLFLSLLNPTFSSKNHSG